MSLSARDPAPTVTPRPAATTLVLRDGAEGLEVLMVRRSLKASFMPGAYVFPGGAVDRADGSPAALSRCDETVDGLTRRLGSVTHTGTRAADFAVGALRECFEECGLWLGRDRADPATLAALRRRLHAGEPLAALSAEAGWLLGTSVLQPFSHWVTPVGIGKRFDTVFFVAPAPAGQEPAADATETTTLAWVHPPQALAERAAGGFPMEFATVSTVRALLPFAGGRVSDLLGHAAALTDVPPLHPRLSLDADGRIAGVLLPGQAGYDTAYTG